MEKCFKLLNGSISVLLYFINTVFWFVPIFIGSFLKLLPIKIWQTMVSWVIDGCASNWITVNNINQKVFSRTKFTVTGMDSLSTKEWYLVVSNHQSWVDILALQRVFNREIPFLKFFLKKELIWVPFLGLAWWALDFPFMRRYSKSFLAKNPHLKGKDLETTKKACEKFRFKPVSIMNFIEGTRVTDRKLANSPYQHLIAPKAGGIAFVLSAMGTHLTKMIDVTIYYPQGIPTYWDFVRGKVKEIKIHIDTMPISEIFDSGAFSNETLSDPKKRAVFQQWLNARWEAKDIRLQEFNQTQEVSR
jgi:1-acyl-sn-glycerol-3-phosphate acyltransferase